jgi:hypothetical protein
MFNRVSHYNQLYSVDARVLPSDSDILDVPSPLNIDEIAALFPSNPSSGQLVDLLSQVLQTENPLLRDSLLSKLESLSPTSSAFSGVDDETKLQLLKPRNMQSLSEMAEFTSFVSSALEQLNVQPHPEPVSDPEPEQDPEPET